MTDIVVDFPRDAVAFPKGCRIDLIILFFQKRLVFLLQKQLYLRVVVVGFSVGSGQRFVGIRFLTQQDGENTARANEKQYLWFAGRIRLE